MSDQQHQHLPTGPAPAPTPAAQRGQGSAQGTSSPVQRPGAPGTVTAAVVISWIALALSVIGVVLMAVRGALTGVSPTGQQLGASFVSVIIALVHLMVLAIVAVLVARLPRSVGTGTRTWLTFLVLGQIFYNAGNGLAPTILLWIAVLVLLYLPASSRWVRGTREADEAERARRREAWHARQGAAPADGSEGRPR
ncbi:hypothetical protein DEO23_13205 [Brachybacterium endophyticum]|uniref:Uncharacterized protein n=1 Tax=Brachybacterium endophyticum TaxID=2182385 RepID=A0A2U2RI36_9MICO|nr:hypothetical protein [Brachybacterium endophyticum]PWH05518.1 hypothetical protein DEO23_13205 [Brachybacterium endophyticum]